MITNDEFLRIERDAAKKALEAIGMGGGIPAIDDFLLPYKEKLLKAKNATDFKSIWSDAIFDKYGNMSLITNDLFWNTLYTEMFNHVGTVTNLDPSSDKIYKLKSSNRKFKVTDAGDDTVVIQFLDDKKKLDLPKKDFDTECVEVEGEN